MTLDPFRPLIEISEKLCQEVDRQSELLEKIGDLFDTKLADCPFCQSGEKVSISQGGAEPEAGSYAVITGCSQCGIATNPQWWFTSEPTSAISALQTSIDTWNTRKSKRAIPTGKYTVMPTAVEASQTELEADAARWRFIREHGVAFESEVMEWGGERHDHIALTLQINLTAPVLTRKTDSVWEKLLVNETIDREIQQRGQQ